MTDDEILASGAIMVVNVFTPKFGQLDAFMDVQIAEYRRLEGKVGGAIANRFGPSLDGVRAVNIGYFASREAFEAWRGSELFKEHAALIEPMLKRVEPGIYEIVYDSVGRAERQEPNPIQY